MARLMFSGRIAAALAATALCLCFTPAVWGQAGGPLPGTSIGGPLGAPLPSPSGPLPGNAPTPRKWYSQTPLAPHPSAAPLPGGPLPPLPGAVYGPYPPPVPHVPVVIPPPAPLRPKSPQSYQHLTPSLPSGVDPRNLSPLPQTNIRELPYLRGHSSAHFVMPPGMELPAPVAPREPRKRTLGDRVKGVLFPLGDPLGDFFRLPKF